MKQSQRWGAGWKPTIWKWENPLGSCTQIIENLWKDSLETIWSDQRRPTWKSRRETPFFKIRIEPYIYIYTSTQYIYIYVCVAVGQCIRIATDEVILDRTSLTWDTWMRKWGMSSSFYKELPEVVIIIWGCGGSSIRGKGLINQSMDFGLPHFQICFRYRSGNETNSIEHPEK